MVRVLMVTAILGVVALALAGGDKETVEPTSGRNLIANGSLRKAAHDGRSPAGFALSGDATYGELGRVWDRIGKGVRLSAADDLNKDGQHAAELQATVENLSPGVGRWFRLRIVGLAQDSFRVAKDDIYLQVDFYRDRGASSLDHVKKSIYPLIELDRAKLKDDGTNNNLGAAIWRSFDLDFRTPFAEVDTLVVHIGFGHGQPAEKDAEFWIKEIELTPIPVPADYEAPKGGRPIRRKQQIAGLVPLGGRWYYDPRGDDRTAPAQFDLTNADRLLYLAAELETPFADNMSAWLKKGFLDRDGNVIKDERFVPDNVVISFTKTDLVIKTKNLPNHPTAAFPDHWAAIDGNPNYIQEQDSTWHIPLVPREASRRSAMQNKSNENQALPMGPIGVAVNGVAFFHPFDHILNEEAIWRLDRCCGHPAPTAMYHYHKYPVCVKSPWSDDGSGHSPLIGFAFDGFPIYGPYESAGELAKDSQSNPLNDFNIHEDADRGWHYHVTPGKFPHVIGGFWGEVDLKNRGRGGPPGGKGAPGGTGPPGGKGFPGGKGPGGGKGKVPKFGPPKGE
jgi:hypothetical protein